MINTIKNRIKNYIDLKIEERFIRLSEERHNRDQPLWESRTSLTLPPKKFANLSDVSHYRNKTYYIRPEDLNLEKHIDEYIEKDKFPLPSPEDREGYGDDRHFEYWLSGLGDYLNIKKNLKKHGYSLEPGHAVYDMGCASGRVVRQFFCHEEGLELWASDINSNHVEWILKYFGGNIRVFQNHSLPHLPLEDNSLDLIYAFSVFSHIDTFELAWLSELRRILKPGGLAYLTTHTDHTWSIIKEGDTVYELLSGHPDFSPELLKSELVSGKTVFRWQTDNCYSANVFHTAEYVNDVWSRYFEIQEIIPEGHFYQDVILLRKN
ncbi:MAG: hypothetical protein DRI57_07025 [Deltaproteobacteria bacterium]|nr:MAG: hypothetical protein DRI57_07025 [Deltaproteobacteria bacterium]